MTLDELKEFAGELDMNLTLDCSPSSGLGPRYVLRRKGTIVENTATMKEMMQTLKAIERFLIAVYPFE